MPRPRRVEVWSDLQCQSGVRLAVLRGALSARETQHVRALPELTLEYPASATAHAQIAEGRVIRFDYSDSSFDEWVITGIGEIRMNLQVTLDCVGPGIKLASVLASRSDSDGSVTLDFEAPSLTPTQNLANFLIPPATAAGLAFTLGTVDPTAPVDMRYGFGQENGWDSSLSALQRLAQVARGPGGGPCEISFRRNGTSGYFIDLLHQVGASASTFDVRFGRGMPEGWRRRRATDRQATRIFPRGAETDGVAASIARARWKVTAITGAGPYDITLADPVGAEGPIGFDDQLNGLYLRKVDGSLIVVADSVASTQKITVASSSGIAVNDLVEFRRNSSGAWIIQLDHPTNIAPPPSGYGLLGRTLLRPDIPGTVNLGDNTVCREYSGGSSTLPDRWTKVGSPTITKNTSDFTRIRYGPASFRLQGVNDGDGADTPYTKVFPTAASAIFPSLLGFWLETGQVRVELIAAKDPISVTSIVRSGSTVTVTTSGAHGLAKYDRAEVLGADQTAYNGIRLVTSVPSSTAFTFEVAGSPTTPATGTITAAWCRRIPEGTEGWAGTNETKQWHELGIDDQATNLQALGVKWVKLRIVQDGATACDAYVNYYQVTQSPTQLPFVEGSGPTKLWQEGNRYLKAYSVPFVSYEGPAVSLREIDAATWPWDSAAPTLGGAIKVSDPTGYGTVTSRILGYTKDPFSPALHQLVLSDDPGDLIDILTGDRRPPARPKSITTSTDPQVEWTVSRPPNTPGTVNVALTARPSANATIYYWVGEETDDPPPASVVQAGTPSDTAWGTYTAPFGVDQIQDADLRVWVYCVAGNNRGKQRFFNVDRDELPEIDSLTLQEGGSLSVISSWTPDDDVRSVRVYSAVGAWPTTVLSITTLTRSGSVARAVTASAHHLKNGDLVKVAGASGSQFNIEATVTVIDDYTFEYTISGTPTSPDGGVTKTVSTARGDIDESKFNVEKAVNPNGGGYTSAGVAEPGGTTYGKTGYSNADQVYVIVVPIDWRGLVGPPEYRGADKITLASAPTPRIIAVTASRTGNGSACGAGTGAVYSFTFTESNLVNGTHKFRAIVTRSPGDEFWAASDTTPSGGGTVTITTNYKVTNGKLDPTAYMTLSWELLDGSDEVIQSGTWGNDSFKSSCIPPD